MIDIHIEGGLIYMAPLTLLLLINFGVILFVLLSRNQDKQFWIEAVRQIGGLALVWGIFSTIIGFYYAFGDLSTMKDTLPFSVIMGGLKVAMITAVYGLIIFIISLIAFISLKVANRSRTQ